MKNVGRQAFPVFNGKGPVQGMSLRDFFAGLAMQGLIHEWPSVPGGNKAEISKRAYEMADAMLEAREKED